MSSQVTSKSPIHCNKVINESYRVQTEPIKTVSQLRNFSKEPLLSGLRSSSPTWTWFLFLWAGGRNSRFAPAPPAAWHVPPSKCSHRCSLNHPHHYLFNNERFRWKSAYLHLTRRGQGPQLWSSILVMVQKHLFLLVDIYFGQQTMSKTCKRLNGI